MPVLPGSLWGVLSACMLLSAWTSNSFGQEVPKKTAGLVDAKPGEVIANSIGMKLTLIPSGSFTMGSPADEPGRMKDESQVAVTISQPFFLGVTEVTQGQWTGVMGTTPWKGRVGVQQGPNNPATYIRWDDAVEFCKKLSENEGKTYRLPTEAEWEYACRAGSTTAYHFGGDAIQLSEFGWWGSFRDSGNTKTEKYAHLVAQKPANPFGLYDMHGNVMEWCSDWYGKELVGGRDPQGADSGSARVYRGGGCDSSAADCRSAFRLGYWRFLLNYDLGFRVSLQAVR